jgi:hypothetical protein
MLLLVFHGFFFGVILISLSFVDATSEVFAEDRDFGLKKELIMMIRGY